MHNRLPLCIALFCLPALGCAAPDFTAEDTQALGDDEASPVGPGDVIDPDPSPTGPDSCPPTGIGRCGTKLTWNGGAAQLVGYSDYEVATRDGFDRVGYLRDVRPSVNLQRIWASGYSNTGRFCTDACCPFDETLAWTVTGAHNGIPTYDLFSFSPTYTQRLTATLNEAIADHGVVELTLFDHWALSPAQFGVNPWNPANNNLDAHGCHKLDNGAFPAFFQIFESDGTTLNCLGLRQKAYVDRVVSVAKNYNNVVFEMMNEAGGSTTNAELKKWHKAVAGWVRAHGSQLTTAASIFAASLAGEGLSATETAIFGAGVIDIVNLHYREWKAPDDGPGNICTALNKFRVFNKPIVIDDDGGFRARTDNNRMLLWAKTALNGCTPPPMGQKHFNHKDAIAPACRDNVALQKLSTLVQNP
jgi:hypothetical protein